MAKHKHHRPKAKQSFQMAPLGVPKKSTLKPAHATPAYDPRIEGMYQNTVTDLGVTRDNAIGDYNYDINTGGNNYGFKPGYDAAGNPSGNYAVDPSDPFSKMSLLQRSYENTTRGTTNNYASSGQLYSGSLRNAQTNNSFNFEQGKDSLMKDFTDLLIGAVRGKRNAGSDYNSGVASAAGTRLNQQLGGSF